MCDSPTIRFRLLRSVEKRPAQILIADWLMPSMDGLELTRRIKKLDDATGHFTYVMLLTARDDIQAMHEAFKEGVDDFLNKANLRGQLLPRVFAAQRIAERQNELLRTNKLLRRKVRELTTTDLVDPVTGLGNMKFTLDRIRSLSKEVEARGGAACILLVGINNLDVIEKQYDKAVIDELMSGIGAKLRQLVRPLDVVTRPEANMFAVTMLQPDIENCTSTSFRRIFDNLYMHSFKTSEGFIPVVVGVSLVAADTRTRSPIRAPSCVPPTMRSPGRSIPASSRSCGMGAHREPALAPEASMPNRLTRITTRGGDNGKSGLADGSRHAKFALSSMHSATSTS